MIQIENADGHKLIDGAEYIDFIEQVGHDKSLTLYQTDSGRVIHDCDNGNEKFCFIDQDSSEDISLEHIVRAKCSHIKDEAEREIELYRWGIETVEEATLDTFGKYRVLIRELTGALHWHKSGDNVECYANLNEAREACKQIQAHTQHIQPIVV